VWTRGSVQEGPSVGANSPAMADERILVAEDDAALRAVVCDYLRSERYTPIPAADGIEALARWRSDAPDVILLDWMLPGMSGLDVARHVRAAGATPIIMLTARGEEPDIVVGLELGADDYLVKPVSMRQLVARIHAVLRRAHGGPGQTEDRLVLGDLAVDFAGHTVARAGQTIVLTATEFKLLAVLARSPGRVFSRLQLMEAALGDYYEGYERTIDSHVSHIRRKLGEDGPVQTVHGIGYKLVIRAVP